MKKSLDKILKRNIILNIKQFLTIIVIVFLSVTLLSGFLVSSRTLEQSIDKYYAATNLADMWLNVDNVSVEDEKFFNDNEIDYEKRLSFNTKANIKYTNQEINSKIFVYDKGKISTPYIIKELSGVSLEGCWIDQNYAKEKNLIIGQTQICVDFNYQTNDGQLIELNLEFLLTGTMCISEQAANSSKTPILIKKEIFLDKINKALSLKNSNAMYDITSQQIENIQYNEILIKSANLEQIEQKIRLYYENSATNLFMLLKKDSIESVVLLDSEVKQSRQMIYIFPTVFLLVSLLVMISSISQLIIQEKTKIGTLKSIGANNRVLLRHYSGYGGVLSAIGMIAGIIIGPILIPEIMFVKYDLIYSIPKDFVTINYPWLLIFVLSILVILIGYFSAYFVSKKVINKTPTECLKQEIKINLKSRKKRTKLPLSLKMAVRNMKINPIRAIMVMIGVAGCVSLLLCGFGIGDTLKNSVNNDLNKLFNYDISSTYVKNDFIQNLESIEGITKVEKYETFYSEVSYGENLKTTTVYSLKDNSEFSNLGITKGDVFISKSIAENLGVSVGGKLKVSVNGIIQELEVDKIIETAIYNAIFVCEDLVFDLDFATKAVWLSADGQLDEIVENLNKINGTNDAKTMQQTRNYVENKISSISIMTTTLKIFALLLALVVLVNFINLILKERVREIATLKVVGQNLFEISKVILVEVLLLGITGMFFGMILGYPLLLLVLSANKVEMLNYLYHISPLSFIFVFLIVLLIFTIILMLCILKIKKISMVESLKSVE